jgi:DNA-binding PadR family transcriptional regulator
VTRARIGLNLGEYAILALLRERPMHGYEIARRFVPDADLGLVLPLDMSSVYAMLKDLHEHGLIAGHRETVGQRPPRTVYRLTPDADALCTSWLGEPVERLRQIRSDLLVKLYFCRAFGGACTAHLLDAQLAISWAYRDRLAQLAAEADPSSFERLVRDSKLSAARATVDWLTAERANLPE